jgi:hypothetical protein
MVGEVVYSNLKKQFGYIKLFEDKHPRSEYFFYSKDIKHGFPLQVGDLVTCDVGPSAFAPGRQDATNIVLRKRDEIAKAGI